MTLLERLASSFAREHPYELATLVAGTDAQAQGALLMRLPNAEAAAVLTRLAPSAAAGALKAMPEDRAGEMLEGLDAWSVAAVLGRFDERARVRLIDALPQPTAESVRRLLAFTPDQTGSHMDPRAPSVFEGATVGEAVEAVRREPGGALYYVYVVGKNYALRGVVNMRELLSADADSPITSLMTEEPESIRADAPIATLLQHPGWLKVHALPVVDGNGRFLGAIRYSAFRKIEAEAGRAQSGSDPSRTTGALAEIFLLGAAAVARTAGSALLGSAHPRGRES